MPKDEIQEACLSNLIKTRQETVFRDGVFDNEDIALINEIAPSALRIEDVYVRSMYLCSNQPCLSDGCQFTHTALEQIANQIVGQSVLCGHDRRSLPIARFYKARIEPRGQDEQGKTIYFVRAWFYWLRATTGGKDLLLNIDGGIYREVSLAWRYRKWRCSICGRPNGECLHQLGREYEGQRCFRLIDQVEEVLEGSLVYKGADQQTYLAGSRAIQDGLLDEPLFVVTERDDPCLQYLLEHNLISEPESFHEWSSALEDSVNLLWIRQASSNEDMERMQNVLVDGGVSVVEEHDDADLGNYQVYLKRDASMHQIHGGEV